MLARPVAGHAIPVTTTSGGVTTCMQCRSEPAANLSSTGALHYAAAETRPPPSLHTQVWAASVPGQQRLPLRVQIPGPERVPVVGLRRLPGVRAVTPPGPHPATCRDHTSQVRGGLLTHIQDKLRALSTYFTPAAGACGPRFGAGLSVLYRRIRSRMVGQAEHGAAVSQ